MKNKVICVYNKPEIFEKVIQNNKYLKDFDIISYDNREQNTSITHRYNTFIRENILESNEISEEKDFWCIFSHQDFGILEDLNPKLTALSPKCIYGAVGVRLIKGVFFGKKSQYSNLGFKKYLAVEFGRILQGNDDFNFQLYGKKVDGITIVDAIDCCCMIVHSSLIREYRLLFDENLNFHMYAEELCYRTKQDFHILTKVVQFDCFHMGKGIYNEEFEKSAQYLKEKFKIDRIPSTCIN